MRALPEGEWKKRRVKQCGEKQLLPFSIDLQVKRVGVEFGEDDREKRFYISTDLLPSLLH